MTKFIITALTASVAFGSAALAAGDYYEGASKDRPVAVDTIYTGSIAGAHQAFEQPVAIDSGDYYEGANRPN
jgi:hypothetical protein